MTKDNCSPIPSTPTQFFKDEECEGCGDNPENEGCGCDPSDLTWDIAISDCLHDTLGINVGDNLYEIFTKIGDYLCEPPALDCADIDIPNTYLNIGFVGTEYSAEYDLGAAGFPNGALVTIDGVVIDLGIVATITALLTALNATGSGTWTRVGTTVTGVGFFTFGAINVADTDYTPTITETEGIRTLCDLIDAIDDKFGVVDTTLVTLQTEIDALGKGVLYNNVTDVVTSGTISFDDLKTYSLLAGTLVNDGDMLIIEAEYTTDDTSDNNIGKGARITFDSNVITYALGFAIGLISLVKKRVKITRVSNTEVNWSSETEIYSTGFFTFDMQGKAGFPNTSITGLDLDANNYDIIAHGSNLNTGDTAVTNKSLQIRIAHI